MITVFKTPTCAYCVQTIKYLTAKGKAVTVVDVSKEQPKEYVQLATQYGYSMPLVTDGSQTYTGWNLPLLNKMLSL
jgi:glutaredoxin